MDLDPTPDNVCVDTRDRRCFRVIARSQLKSHTGVEYDVVTLSCSSELIAVNIADFRQHFRFT